MKTIEEVAREIFESMWITYPTPGELENISSILRADREEVLRRVEEVFSEGPPFIPSTGDGVLTQWMADHTLAVVKKEAL